MAAPMVITCNVVPSGRCGTYYWTVVHSSILPLTARERRSLQTVRAQIRGQPTAFPCRLMRLEVDAITLISSLTSCNCSQQP